jgi:uncharacterized caspase-like protein
MGFIAEDRLFGGDMTKWIGLMVGVRARLRWGVILLLALCVACPTASSAVDYLAMKPQDALVALNREIAKASSPKKMAQLLSDRSNVYWVHFIDFDRAFADASEAKKLSPSIGLYHRQCGYLLANVGQLDRAQSEYDNAIKVASPVLVWDYLERAEFHWDFKGDFEPALDDLNKAIEMEGTFNNTPLLRRGKLYRANGKYDLALADFNKLLSINPKDSAGFENRGLLYMSRGDYNLALADLNKSIALGGKTTSYMNRAEVWRARGDLDKAIADLDRGIALNPRQATALAKRGDVFRYLGQTEKAMTDFEAALKVAPDSAPALVGRGLTYERLGNLEKAKADFTRSLKQPENRYGVTKLAQETARARLAAIESGVEQPIIPAAPSRAERESSLPTPAIVAPRIAQPTRPDAGVTRGRRVALVIGNSDYRKVPALANPQKDSDAVAASLRNIGFETVTLRNNATREDLIGSLRAFAEQADKADWAMVYYAGHGIEVNGQNHLIPIDATLKTDRDVQFEAVAMDQVMASIDGAKKLKLIVLDACRDNPFAPKMEKTGVRDVVAANSTAGGVVGTRSIGRGLGEVKVSGASLVVFAAKHGQTALDGEGANSPFAVALVQRIATPGVEINKVFRLVRDDVMEATAGRQEPYTYGSLPGREDFFFVAAK